jgi:hypothetical protein
MAFLIAEEDLLAVKLSASFSMSVTVSWWPIRNRTVAL